ncbi:MAG: restriction endonuclease subunit R, partial [Candidatus Aenigmarchaeota archaeon]|nr:restriction endonuclease subunit R [Candidatus Aenigmarchaeota archaeon]
GAAFHHAGLANPQRKLVEGAFKQGLVKILTATPTLAAGINIPAYRVIVRDLKRFQQFKGMDYLPNMEIEQMTGRAGRPQFEKEGEGILIAKTQVEAAYAWENYIKGKPEKIYSKVGVEPVLRMHSLALISSATCHTTQELFDFYSKTFYAKQYQDFGELKKKIEKMLGLLEKFNFITKSNSQTSSDSPFKPATTLANSSELKPTLIGKRVSELYIDPITADYLIATLNKLTALTPFSLLHVMCRCLEARPLISAKKKDMEYIEEILAREVSSLVDKLPNEWDIEYEGYLDSIKTACFFSGWLDELGEDMILEKFNVTPGELRARLDIADWLLYSMAELALLLDLKENLKNIKKLRVRMEYGIKEELLTLVRLKGVGRVRARLLFNSGIKDLGDLRKIPVTSLARIVGEKIAENLKSQVEPSGDPGLVL